MTNPATATLPNTRAGTYGRFTGSRYGEPLTPEAYPHAARESPRAVRQGRVTRPDDTPPRPVSPGPRARSSTMNRTDLPIATPCSADWSTMTLADRGRFCGACSKVVRELAQLTETEARALLASPPTEGLCVRYMHDATGEILFRRDAVVPVSRLVRRAAMVALAAALPLSTAACMGAAPPQPLMGAAPYIAPPPSASAVAVPQVMMGAPPAMPAPSASAPTDPVAPPAPVAAPR